MRIKVYFNKNLKMSPPKLAAQVGHVTKELGRCASSNFSEDSIVVLGVSNNKFNNLLKEITENENIVNFHAQIDNGVTEVPAGTMTAFGYIVPEE